MAQKKYQIIWLVWLHDAKKFMDKIFTKKADACHEAAEEYGYDTYSEANREGWCKVVKTVAEIPTE